MTAPVCHCLARGEEDRPYALVTLNEIPWRDRMPVNPGPHTYSLCADCARNVARMLKDATREAPP